MPTQQPQTKPVQGAQVVGRVAALLRFVVDPTGQPAAALIEGEAGIGKTTLFDGLIGEARDRGKVPLQNRPGIDITLLASTVFAQKGLDRRHTFKHDFVVICSPGVPSNSSGLDARVRTLEIILRQDQKCFRVQQHSGRIGAPCWVAS